jgi:hypothetical protein
MRQEHNVICYKTREETVQKLSVRYRSIYPPKKNCTLHDTDTWMYKLKDRKMVTPAEIIK